MQTFTGRCLCGQSHFTVDVEMLDVYACHCTLCQKWSGGIAMYLEACGQPQLAPFPGTAILFILFARRTLLLFRLRVSAVVSAYRYRSLFYSPTLLELNEVDRRRLILAAEIYTETQPAFWRLTGQYARLSGKEVEEMDSPAS